MSEEEPKRGTLKWTTEEGDDDSLVACLVAAAKINDCDHEFAVVPKGTIRDEVKWKASVESRLSAQDWLNVVLGVMAGAGLGHALGNLIGAFWR